MRDEEKSSVSLDAYNYFLSAKVGSICLYNVDGICLVSGEAEASQTMSKTSLRCPGSLLVDTVLAWLDQSISMQIIK